MNTKQEQKAKRESHQRRAEANFELCYVMTIWFPRIPPMTSPFLLRVLLLNLPCSSQSRQRYSSHIAIRINILLYLSIHSVTWLCGRGPDWLHHGSTAGKDVSVSFFFFPFQSNLITVYLYYRAEHQRAWPSCIASWSTEFPRKCICMQYIEILRNTSTELQLVNKSVEPGSKLLKIHCNTIMLPSPLRPAKCWSLALNGFISGAAASVCCNTIYYQETLRKHKGMFSSKQFEII